MILANNTLDNTTIDVLNYYINEIQKYINKEYNIDIISYTGEISESVVNGFQELIEGIKENWNFYNSPRYFFAKCIFYRCH